MNPRTGEVFLNKDFAGTLSQTSGGFVFAYDERFFLDPSKPAISLTLPKTMLEHRSYTLFPFFFGLLAEGENKAVQCRNLKIDERDHFTRLLKTAHTETIGAVTIRESNAHR